MTQRTIARILLRSGSRLRLGLGLCTIASVARIRLQVLASSLIIAVFGISRSGFSFGGSFSNRGRNGTRSESEECNSGELHFGVCRRIEKDDRVRK